MNHDQMQALLDVVAAAHGYLTAPSDQLATRRASLCDALGRLAHALEEPPVPDADTPEGREPNILDCYFPEARRLARRPLGKIGRCKVLPLRPATPRPPREPDDGGDR